MPFADGRDLVTGASGFLGRHLVARLKADGREVIEVARQDGDLADTATVRKLFSASPPVDRIFHTVTRQRTGASQYGLQGELLGVNARVHLNVLDAWREFQPGAKLISTGSSCTYPESLSPVTEGQFGLGPTHPSVYGYALAKQIIATGSVAYAHQYGLRCLHCVLATMYGPGDHKEPDRSHFVGALLDRAVREKIAGAESFSVWGDPGTVREILYVNDQIDAILAADCHFENEILNCAANMPITVGEVASSVLQALDWDVPIRHPTDSFQGAGYKMLGSSRFLGRTGWSPSVPVVEGLSRIVQIEYSAAIPPRALRGQGSPV